MQRVTLAMAVGALLMAAPAWAGPVVKHSGTIASEDLTSGRLIIQEMGPWHGTNKALHREVVLLTPRTRIELAERSEHPASGWRGGFAEEPLKPRDLKPGDFVTAAVTRQGGHSVATEMTVVRPGDSSAR